jgi:hypothetical protein
MEDPYPVENIDRLGVLMFQTSDNSQLLRRELWINAELTIVWSLKHKNTQPIYIFNRKNPQNSEPQNDPRRGLDFIALQPTQHHFLESLLSLVVYQTVDHNGLVWDTWPLVTAKVLKIRYALIKAYLVDIWIGQNSIKTTKVAWGHVLTSRGRWEEKVRQ